MSSMSGNDCVEGSDNYGSGSGFTLIIVLFILLIIVGAALIYGPGGSSY